MRRDQRDSETAPNGHRRRRPANTPRYRAQAASLIGLALLASALLPSSAGAVEPPTVRTFCQGAQGDPNAGLAGHCVNPRGIAVDPTSGEAYVADGSNHRIQKFTPWGDVLRAWGWDVVQSGPGNEPPSNEIQEVIVDATGGAFALKFHIGGGSQPESGEIAFDASAASVQSALEKPAQVGPGDVAVSGPSGGPWTIEFTGQFANREVGRLEAIDSTLSGGSASAVAATVQDGGNFEVCVPAAGDVCKSGQRSEVSGGLAFPGGVTLDAAGNVYVAEPSYPSSNSRVQKFSPAGEFLLTFGGEVNETKVREREEQEANAEPITVTEAQENLCTAASGDRCTVGTKGTGNGQFGDQMLQASSIAASPDGATIYVGDVDRIQEFNPGGEYQGQLPLPEAGTVGPLAVDPVSGDLYFGYEFEFPLSSKNHPPQPNVHRLDPISGEELDTLELPLPRALAVDAVGHVYAYQEENIHSSTPPHFNSEFLEFDSSGKLLETFPGGDFNRSIGIATSSACGIDGVDLFISNFDSSNSFVRIYGPPPDANLCPPPPLPPSVIDQYAVSVGAEGAVVKAAINPRFWPDTTYFVQYASADCIEAGGWEAPCVKAEPDPPGVLLSNETFDEARATKGIFLGATEALSAETEYRYRFVAESSGGGPVFGAEAAFRTYPLPAPPKSDCPNQAFRSAASAHLPDCRAYEMVSPPDKNGGEVGSPREALTQAAIDGDALTYASITGFANPQAAPLLNQYMASRGAGGWSTASINAPRGPLSLVFGEFVNPRYKTFNEDLCSGWFLQDTNVQLLAGAPKGLPNLYRNRGLREGCGEAGYQLLTTVFPPGYDPAVEQNESAYYPEIQGFSADERISAFRAAAALSPEACQTPNQGKGIFQLYLSEEGTPGVSPKLLSVLPNGQASCANSSVGTAQAFSASFYTRDDSYHHAISTDGSRAYWSTNNNKLYVRINATQPQSALNKSGKCTEAAKACTLPVSEKAEALSKTEASSFRDAATDGSVAIFLSGEDLYEFDLAKALSQETPTSLIAHEVKGVLGASEDASRVYLVSTEALDKGAPGGKSNLYLYERGGFDFIATLGGPADLLVGNSTSPSSSIGLFPHKRLSRVSPDGLHAAFTSDDPALAEAVAGYDNTDLTSGRPDREIYLYDAAGDGSLVCVSCNPSGARPAGRAIAKLNLDDDVWAAASLPGWITSMQPGGALSEDGTRLFFESFEPLVLRDTNGRADVYQWQRAEDKTQCLAEIGGELYVATSGGCLSLISSGTAAADSQLIDASPDGSDVFIRTDAALLPQDPGFADAYDARVGGGFPQPTATAACEGEACAPPPSPPDDPTPASSAFEGPGNLSQGNPKPRCPKGKRKVVRRGKSRCVARKSKASAKRQRRANAKRRAGR